MNVLPKKERDRERKKERKKERNIEDVFCICKMSKCQRYSKLKSPTVFPILLLKKRLNCFEERRK